MDDITKEMFDIVVGYLATRGPIRISIETVQAHPVLNIINICFPRTHTPRPYKARIDWITINPEKSNTLLMFGFCTYPGKKTGPYILQLTNPKKIKELLHRLHTLIMIQELEG